MILPDLNGLLTIELGLVCSRTLLNFVLQGLNFGVRLLNILRDILKYTFLVGSFALLD